MRSKADAEAALAQQLTLARVPFDQQFSYVPGRKFAADFHLVGTQYLVEIQGGVYPFRRQDGRLAAGAHGSVEGIKRDNERLNAASLAGWRVLRFLPEEVGTLLDPASQQALTTILEALAREGVA